VTTWRPRSAHHRQTVFALQAPEAFTAADVLAVAEQVTCTPAG
jgi:hypothetical protein